MSLPHILVIDDQYARDAVARLNFLEKTHLTEKGKGDLTNARKDVGWAVFCPGQRQVDGRIENDYEVIRAAVRQNIWALILLDVRFDSGPMDADGRVSGQPGDEDFGEYVRQRLEDDFSGLPVVMLSSKPQEEISDHITPYLSKQWLTERELRKTLLLHGGIDPEQTRQLLGLEQSVVARAPATIMTFREAFLHASSDVSVLIFGESGVGKEVLARYLHDLSNRCHGLFVPVNVAAIPRELVESELFGHERGAFTGATNRRYGWFERAKGGSLFLDEIGDMPLEVQTKVLRTIQERELTRVGGENGIKLDIRLICATSRDLPGMIKEGSFREDLYHRISTVPIRMPPLYERKEDIVPLVEAFLNKTMTDSGKQGVRLAEESLSLIKQYPFPGNVRELENLIRRLVSAAGHHEVISANKVKAAMDAHVAPRPNTRQVKGEPESISRQIRLIEMVDAMAHVVIDHMDPALPGIKPRLEKTFQGLLQCLAGASLERCRNPVTGKLNRQNAMQMLTGESKLTGKGPGRVINEILGRKQEYPVDEADLENLVQIWHKAAKQHTEEQ